MTAALAPPIDGCGSDVMATIMARVNADALVMLVEAAQARLMNAYRCGDEGEIERAESAAGNAVARLHTALRRAGFTDLAALARVLG